MDNSSLYSLARKNSIWYVLGTHELQKNAHSPQQITVDEKCISISIKRLYSVRHDYHVDFFDLISVES